LHWLTWSLSEFFKVSQHLTGLSRITSASDRSKVVPSGNEGRVLVNWGFIKMELPFHPSVRQLDSTFGSSVPEAIEDFQTTFPYKHGFRVPVIDEALDFADSIGENESTVVEDPGLVLIPHSLHLSDWHRSSSSSLCSFRIGPTSTTNVRSRLALQNPMIIFKSYLNYNIALVNF
jgi:hypothetical protein